jgi:CRISPR/Cas system type I-B associated protein Csh2 (Cas7 group RAMP superfamily)
LPLNENELPRQRKGAKSREELSKRMDARIKRAIREGDPFLGAELNDLLHVSVGDREANAFASLYDRIDGLLDVKES